MEFVNFLCFSANSLTWHFAYIMCIHVHVTYGSCTLTSYKAWNLIILITQLVTTGCNLVTTFSKLVTTLHQTQLMIQTTTQIYCTYFTLDWTFNFVFLGGGMNLWLLQLWLLITCDHCNELGLRTRSLKNICSIV